MIDPLNLTVSADRWAMLAPVRAALVLLVLALTVACARTPTVVPVAPPTFDEKVSWILRLENQRVLRDEAQTPLTPDEGSETPPAEREAPGTRPVPDLVVLLADAEPQLRRRAALAIGRIGLSEGVAPLIAALSDPEVEVRQMSAFALGLLGDPAASAALIEALKDLEPVVQGRAAEALGRIGAVDAAGPIGQLIRSYVTAAFDLDPDDLSYPLSPDVEAFRLGLFALGSLRAYHQIATAVLQENGQPILWWWPVAYALQRTGDPRASAALISLAGVQGTVGVSFAAQGLGKLAGPEAPKAVDALIGLLDLERRDVRVIASAIRALAGVNDPRAGEALRQVALEPDLTSTLRLEAIEALQRRPVPGSADLFVELMTDSWAPMRGAALKALARSDPDTFMLVLSGLGEDSDWRVRVALAEGLAYVGPEAASYRLQVLLQDEEPRVIPSVLESIVSHQLANARQVLLDQLGSDDVVVRKTAATLLGSLHSTDDSADARGEITSALVEAFRMAHSDPSYLARAAIIDTLSAIGGPAAEQTLIEALEDPDWAVRVRAAEGLETLVPEADHFQTIRPAPVRRSVDFGAEYLVRPTVSPHVFIEIDHGTIELELNVIDAPLTADNFIQLVRSGFYDGLTFQRVVPNYVVQGGDPRSDSEGGPGYTVRDELNQLPYLPGTVGMALDWQDTGGSQFFIAQSPQPDLDGRYTAFAKVVAGMDVVDRIERGDVIRRVRVWDGVAPF